MPPVIGKRKRENGHVADVRFKRPADAPLPAKEGKSKEFSLADPAHAAANEIDIGLATRTAAPSNDVCLQIVTGSYERVLHGICARLPSTLLPKTSPANDTKPDHVNQSDSTITFSDTFLLAAHTSSIRCLAISPATESNKRILATGSTDERINLYHLTTVPPPRDPSKPPQPSSQAVPTTSTSSRNRSLGNLVHHERPITRLCFPSKAKLFSAAEDNTVAISRTRDWTVLSSVRAPIPKPHGRPSGDTAGPGEIPAGINDFAIHPSQKLMLSVGRGERCMRLWNLMTGKKGGVLNFDRELLMQVREGKFSSGEGRRVLWDETGEMFVIAFEKGVVVFGVDSKPRAVVRPLPSTKLHRMRFLSLALTGRTEPLLAISTEDGRILFFEMDLSAEPPDVPNLPLCKCVGTLGGLASGVEGRIKDFEILHPSASEDGQPFVVVTGSSDGAVRIWSISPGDFDDYSLPSFSEKANGDGLEEVSSRQTPQVGKLLGTLETGNRITCLGAFVMDGEAADTDQDEFPEFPEEQNDNGGESEDSE